MQTSNLINVKNVFYAKRLLNEAIDGYYFFNDDDIEDTIDYLLITLSGESKRSVFNIIWFDPCYKEIKDKISGVVDDIYK